MPPLLSARTCWRAGWALLGLGLALFAVSDPVAAALFDGQGPGAPGRVLYGVLSALTYAAIPGGLVLLVGSLVVRHVEDLTVALARSGAIEAPTVGRPDVARTRGRAVDASADLDDGSWGDVQDHVVDHEPGVR